MEQETKENRIYPINALRVCIDENNGDLAGRIYSKMCEKPLPFENCSELFLRADELFDECGYPQTFQEKRDFMHRKSSGRYARPQVRLCDEAILEQRGRCGTVDILVRSRRRAGWQGAILGHDGIPPMEFQSEMELLKCLSRSIRDRQLR